MAPVQRNRTGLAESPMELNTAFSRSESREDDPDLEGLQEALDVEERNTELQEHFEAKMKHIAKMESHSNVAVLLIDWELEERDYLNTAGEVDRLAAVFRDQYNFHVHTRRLHTKKGKSAKLQMNAHLAEFVLAEDGEDTLLIIYYAGHGVKDKTGLLRLVGGSAKKGNKQLTQVVWTQVERTLDDTQADLFLIFDCCYAGQLAKPIRAIHTRIFDFLGATQKNSTALSPGPDSFTTALTWALTELAREKGFTTTQLQHKIMDAKNFPGDSQLPCLSERGEPSLRRLKIAPLPRTPRATPMEKDQEQKTSSVEYFLNLQFLFSECPTSAIVDDLAKTLRALVKTTDLPLQQVLWRGLFSEDTLKKDFSHVARRMLFKLRRKSMESKLKFPPAYATNGGTLESPASGPDRLPEGLENGQQLHHETPSSEGEPRPVSVLSNGRIQVPVEATEPLPEVVEGEPARKRARFHERSENND